MQKFITIDSVKKEDLNDLFNEICENVIDKAPSKVKKEDLKISAGAKELDNYSPTLIDILTIIAIYDIKFEFTVKYTVSEKQLKEEAKKEEFKKEEVKAEKVLKEVAVTPQPEESKGGGLPKFD